MAYRIALFGSLTVCYQQNISQRTFIDKSDTESHNAFGNNKKKIFDDFFRFRSPFAVEKYCALKIEIVIRWYINISPDDNDSIGWEKKCEKQLKSGNASSIANCSLKWFRCNLKIVYATHCLFYCSRLNSNIFAIFTQQQMKYAIVF